MFINAGEQKLLAIDK